MPGGVVIEPIVTEDLNLGVGTVDVSAPAGGNMRGRQINLSVLALTYTQDWNPGVVMGDAPKFLDISIPGARVGAFVMASHTQSYQDARIVLHGTVIQDDLVRVIMSNSGSNVGGPGGVIPNGRLRVLVFNTGLI